MQPAQYCRDAAAPAGSTFYYGTLFQPPAGRRALFALFALLVEVDAAQRNVQDRAMAHLRLHWWMEEIGRLSSAQTNHPVSLEVRELLRADPGLAEDLHAFISAATALQDGEPPLTYAHWIGQLTKAHGRIWTIAARHVANADAADSARAASVGALLAALEDVQHLPLSLRAGRCLLPARELSEHGLSASDLGLAATRDRVSSYLGETLTRLRADLLEAERGLAATANASLLFAAVMARLGATLCQELTEDSALLLQRRTSLTPIRKLWIAWRTRLSWPRTGH